MQIELAKLKPLRYRQTFLGNSKESILDVDRGKHLVK